LIDNIIPILALCVTVVAGLLGFGWKLSDKVDSLRGYLKDIETFESRQRAKEIEVVERLYHQVEQGDRGTRIGKMLDVVLELAGKQAPAREYYKEMRTSCSDGGKSLIYAGLVAIAFPIMFYFYSDKFAQVFTIFFYLVTIVVVVLGAYCFLEVMGFMRNRDKLAELLEK
jgi:hypothetical protein